MKKNDIQVTFFQNGGYRRHRSKKRIPHTEIKILVLNLKVKKKNANKSMQRTKQRTVEIKIVVRIKTPSND